MLLGVDGYPRGWVGAALGDDGRTRLVTGPTVTDLVAQVPDVRVVAVDIPIGLCDDGRRACDVAAKRFLGARSSTVFLTPVRAALTAASYAEANERSRALTGGGISAQAYALRARILEVDEWVRHTPVPVYEVHPEVCFARMSGRVLTSRKTTWLGAEQRRRALAEHGIELLADDDTPHDVPVADVLDAAACAWTARRIEAGTAECFPDPPQQLGGRPCAIRA